MRDPDIVVIRRRIRARDPKSRDFDVIGAREIYHGVENNRDNVEGVATWSLLEHDLCLESAYEQGCLVAGAFLEDSPGGEVVLSTNFHLD